MRTIIVLLGLLAVFVMPVRASTAAPEKFYYVGEMKLSSVEGKRLGSQVFLLEKIHDPDKSLIIERAIVIEADGKVAERVVRMVVKDDNTFTLTDDAKTVEGSGKLFGPAWKWTYFKATYKARNGVRIEDENYMSDPSMVTARKKVTGPDDRILMFMETTVKSITPQTFEILRTSLMKK